VYICFITNEGIKVGKVVELSYVENVIVYSRYIPNFMGTGMYISPFRSEGKASFAVDAERGLWNDFGLGEGGDAVNLVMRCERITMSEAINYIPEILRGLSSNYERILSILPKPEKGSGMPAKRELQFGTMSTEMACYLNNRGIETNRWQREGVIKYCNLWGKGWLYFDYGGDKYKLMRWGEDGKEVLIGGGSLSLWNPYGFTDGYLLCEGELDCLTAMQCGYRAVSVPMGAGNFKKEWLLRDSLEIRTNTFSREMPRKLLAAFDNDRAGLDGATNAHIAGGSTTQIFVMPWDRPFDGEDLNSYYSKHGNLDFIRERYGVTFDVYDKGKSEAVSSVQPGKDIPDTEDKGLREGYTDDSDDAVAAWLGRSRTGSARSDSGV
jgi:hypothetical protein